MSPRPDDRELNTYIVPTNETVSAGVGIPFLQALIGGILAGLVVGAAISYFKVNSSPWAAGGLAGCTFALMSWLSYRGRWAWRLERLLGRDLSGDGFIGKPPAEKIKVELIEDEGRSTTFIDLPHADKIPALAEGLLNGRTFSMTTWTGAGHLLSRKQLADIREECLARGLARWNNEAAHEKGATLTKKGVAVMREIVRRSPTAGLKLRD